MSRDLVDGIPFAYKSDNSRHDACIPLERRQAMAAMRTDGKRPMTTWDELRNDFITKDKLFINRVDKEVESVKLWQANWGFMANLDSKGNPVEPVPLPDKLSRFSDNVPNTNSANYGSRVQTSAGKNLSKLEWKILGHYGKRKVDQEINCNY